MNTKQEIIEQSSKAIQKNIDRNLHIFFRRIHGGSYKEISIEHNLSEKRIEQICTRMLYRFGKKEADAYFQDKLCSVYRQIDYLENKEEWLIDRFNDELWEIRKIKKQVIEDTSIEKTASLRHSTEAAFAMFDKKLQEIHQRIDDILYAHNKALSILDDKVNKILGKINDT